MSTEDGHELIVVQTSHDRYQVTIGGQTRHVFFSPHLNGWTVCTHPDTAEPGATFMGGFTDPAALFTFLRNGNPHLVTPAAAA